MVATLFAVLPLLQVVQGSPSVPWKIAGTNPANYAMTVNGLATDAAGATLSLRSLPEATPTAYGTVTGHLAADTFRGRKVRISADLETRDVSSSASVWLRADSGKQILVLDNGADQAIKGTAGPRRMDVTIYVPASATMLYFGLLLSGTGEATARHMRVAARPRVAPDAPMATAAKNELDAAFTIVKRSSLWRDTVTWSKVEPEVRAIAAGAETVNDVYPAIRLLLSRLGDHHSFLMKPQGAQEFRSGGADNPRPVVRVERLGIGYVSVPGYSGGEHSAALAFAQSMQDSLAAAVASGAGVCRWIVDLREDVGGNMWPMLGGLRPLLGDAGLGAFVSAKGSSPLWHASDQVNVVPAQSLTLLDSANVAVLTGPRTASSGEAVAISFRGRPRTRSFGQPTAGLSTANENFTLPHGAMILLTVAIEADRTGKRYGDKIEPDEPIPAPLSGTTGDPQLTRAIDWLASQTCAVSTRSATRPEGRRVSRETRE